MAGDWPCLWIEATYLKIRQAGRIVSAAVIVAVGVNGASRRKVLGMDVGPSEAEVFWTELLRARAGHGEWQRKSRQSADGSRDCGIYTTTGGHSTYMRENCRI